MQIILHNLFPGDIVEIINGKYLHNKGIVHSVTMKDEYPYFVYTVCIVIAWADTCSSTPTHEVQYDENELKLISRIIDVSEDALSVKVGKKVIFKVTNARIWQYDAVSDSFSHVDYAEITDRKLLVYRVYCAYTDITVLLSYLHALDVEDNTRLNSIADSIKLYNCIVRRICLFSLISDKSYRCFADMVAVSVADELAAGYMQRPLVLPKGGVRFLKVYC